ncbi:MAG: TrkA family potassium uptake protein [Methanobrevibacter sp.]|jgi:trk system potassium uptake protein TrkA|nr:TrkA family potassium uptake protein [Candidatus Methanovirga aequatorialis]
MYVIIMGAGRVGIALAELLIENGYDVTIIENREGDCSRAAMELDAMVICGTGTDSKILEEANISEANFFVAVTGNDDTNLLSCVLAKKYGAGKIISRVSNLEHEDAFKEVGIDKVINPELTAAGFLEKIISRPNVADLTVFGKGDAEILDMEITNDKINGKRIHEVSPADDYIIIAVYHGGKLKIPKPDDVLNTGNKISILVKKGTFKKASKVFTGK